MPRSLVAVAVLVIAGCTTPPPVAGDPCDPNPCDAEHPRCAAVDGRAVCSAVPVETTGPCETKPCTEPNRGVCVESGTTAVCQCDPGFEDVAGTCRAAVSCTPNPCTQTNRTQCAVNGASVTCSCDPGFSDDGTGRCVAPSVCAPNPCTQPNRGVCTEVAGAAQCGCNPGFEERAGACVPLSPCMPNPCTRPNETVCSVNADAGTSCACDPGHQPAMNGCEPVPPPTCIAQHTTGDAFEPDECPMLAKPIVSGVPQDHTIDPVADVDFFSFSADAGAIVRLEETTSFGTTLTLFATNGTSTITNSSTGNDVILTKLPSAGRYFLRARAATASATGAYTLRFTDLGFDDHPDLEQGTATLTPTTQGTELAGTFETAGDVDVLGVPVVQGRVYRFEETSTRNVVVKLVVNGSRLFELDSPEALVWKSTLTGTAYFSVRSFTTAATGGWTMRVTDLGTDDQPDVEGTATGSTVTPTSTGATLNGAFEAWADRDVVAVPVVKGRVYRFEETSPFDVVLRLWFKGSRVVELDSPESYPWKATDTGTAYFEVRPTNTQVTGAWAMRVVDVGPDDQSDFDDPLANVVAPTAAGATLSGTADAWGDWDLVAVPVTQGRVYRFEETTPLDVTIRLIANGSQVVQLDAPESYPWKATLTGTVFFGVRPTGSQTTGAWAMRITDLGPDDQADGEAGATVLLPGATLAGVFETWSDWDVLQVPLTAGTIYRFEETSSTDVVIRLAAGATTFVGPLDSPEWHQLRPASDGPVFFWVRSGSSQTTNPWALKVTALGTDDHGDDRQHATPLALGAAELTGTLNFAGDADYFSFEATAGALSFQLATTSSETTRVRVESSTGSVVLTRDSTGAATFTVPAPGTYFVRLGQASSQQVSSYSIRVSN